MPHLINGMLVYCIYLKCIMYALIIIEYLYCIFLKNNHSGGSTYRHQDHRALDDVLVTVSLWFHLKKKLDILYNSPSTSGYIHQKLLLTDKKKDNNNKNNTVGSTNTTYSRNSKISFYTLIASMPAQEVKKLLFM